jgi:hypothetical protein
MPYSPASQKALHVDPRRVRYSAPNDDNMMSYITERSATTHIAMHPELRLVA